MRAWSAKSYKLKIFPYFSLHSSLFLVKSMDIYVYINVVDTTGQRTRLYPNKCVLACVTPYPKNYRARLRTAIIASTTCHPKTPQCSTDHDKSLHHWQPRRSGTVRPLFPLFFMRILAIASSGLRLAVVCQYDTICYMIPRWISVFSLVSLRLPACSQAYQNKAMSDVGTEWEREIHLPRLDSEGFKTGWNHVCCPLKCFRL
jgi:hypothetical protein